MLGTQIYRKNMCVYIYIGLHIYNYIYMYVICIYRSIINGYAALVMFYDIKYISFPFPVCGMYRALRLNDD